MKVNVRGSSLILTFQGAEREVFGALPGRLRALLERPDARDKVVRRLFPRASDDPEIDRELRELLMEDLRTRKIENLGEIERLLAGRTGARLELQAAQVERLLLFINDMRLFLGTALDVEDDDWPEKMDPRHPVSEDWALFFFLSWLQTAILDQSYGVPPLPFGDSP